MGKTLKKCTKCLIELPLDAFYTRKTGINAGEHLFQCKTCYAAQYKAYRKTDLGKENAKKRKAKYLQTEAGAAKRKETHRQYRIRNKDKLAEYTKTYRLERKKTDINFRLACNIRSRTANALKRNYKKGSSIKDLGCTLSELKLHLESKFLPGMTWENWTVEGWHIDHIIPLSSFDLANKEEFIKAVHYTNLQPMWSLDNLQKGSKL